MLTLVDRPKSTLGTRRIGGRPREVSRRRPGGRFVEYACAPTRVVAARGIQEPSVARVRVRLLVAGVLAAVVLVGVGCGLAALRGSGGVSMPSRTGVVQVHQGETLSGVAARVAPGAPSAEVVHQIMVLNGLGGAAIRVGQALVVPLAG